jgi:hypothetical protein
MYISGVFVIGVKKPILPYKGLFRYSYGPIIGLQPAQNGLGAWTKSNGMAYGFNHLKCMAYPAD